MNFLINTAAYSFMIIFIWFCLVLVEKYDVNLFSAFNQNYIFKISVY